VIKTHTTARGTTVFTIKVEPGCISCGFQDDEPYYVGEQNGVSYFKCYNCLNDAEREDVLEMERLIEEENDGD
jgi:hypothetical protein